MANMNVIFFLDVFPSENTDVFDDVVSMPSEEMSVDTLNVR